MTEDLKVGDHVEWNSEAGRVTGTIRKRHTSEIEFKGYTVHASREEPQYLIKSDRTDHLAMHKGSSPKNCKRQYLIRRRPDILRAIKGDNHIPASWLKY